jgi:CTD small phosphatase-like protein 2
MSNYSRPSQSSAQHQQARYAPQQTPQRPQQQQQQQQQQRGQQQPGSPYADPGSPIASVVQRTKPKSTTTDQSVHYAPGTPQVTSPAITRMPHSPHLFSPRVHHHQQNAPQITRYRHPDQVSTELHEKQIPFVESIGTAATQIGVKNGVNTYAPPCCSIIGRLLQLNSQFNTPAANNAHHEYNSLVMEFSDELQPYHLIRSLPALPRTPRKSPIPPKRPDAPRITLALDLDETLVHCTLTSDPVPCAFTFPVDFNGQSYTVSAQIRPHLEYFLRQVAQWFEVIIFTASQKSYADSLLNIVDPMNEFITHRVFRDSCVHVDSNYIKDLSVLGRNIEHLIIVDNSVQAFGYHLNNGIPIESWFSDESDKELLDLIPLLRHLKDVHDVRPYIRDYFQLQEFVDQLSDS